MVSFPCFFVAQVLQNCSFTNYGSSQPTTQSLILSVGHHLWDKQNHRYKYQTTFVPSCSPENHGKLWQFFVQKPFLAHLRFPRNRVMVHRVQRVSRPVLPVPITCWTAPWPVEISQSLVESIGFKWKNH